MKSLLKICIRTTRKVFKILNAKLCRKLSISSKRNILNGFPKLLNMIFFLENEQYHNFSMPKTYPQINRRYISRYLVSVKICLSSFKVHMEEKKERESPRN